MLFEQHLKTIDEKADVFCGISDTLWDDAELSFEEFKAAEMLTKILENEGFTVERGVANIPTAFKATYGSGSPKLGILAEYDVLSGMSQVACVAEKKSIPGKDTAHGCGHNLFAGGSVAAAFAVKKYIEDTGKGSITLFGCPGEEGAGGKCSWRERVSLTVPMQWSVGTRSVCTWSVPVPRWRRWTWTMPLRASQPMPVRHPIAAEAPWMRWS